MCGDLEENIRLGEVFLSFPGHSYCFKVCDNINFLSIVGKELEQKARAVKMQEETFLREERRACAWRGGCCGEVRPHLDVCVFGETLRHACVGISVLHIAGVS